MVLCSTLGCNLTKKVPEKALLLRQNVITENGNKATDPEVAEFLQQRPNARLLGVPLWLYMYNLADEKSEEKYWAWLERHPKTHRFLEKLLSKKQVGRLGESFLISGKDRMLLKLGDAPVVLDTALTRKTANTFKAYYNSKGYFNAKVDYKIEPLARKKQGKVSYSITTGEAYFLDSLHSKITSAELDSVYQKNLSERIIQPGQAYSLQKMNEERNRLNTLFRNRGFYNFQQNSISFNVERDTSALSQDRKINVTTHIDKFVDRSGENSQKRPYVIHRLGRINIYTDYDFSNPSATYDTLKYKDLTIYAKDKKRFRPSMLYNAIALRNGGIYRDDLRTYTYRQLSNLRTFKYPNIQYVYSPLDSLHKTLDVNIFLSPLQRFSLEANTEITHSEIQDVGIGFSASLLSRNLFRGAETLEVVARGMFGAQDFLKDSETFFNVFEYGGDIRFTIPRMWFFINTQRWIPRWMTPRTKLQFGSTFQKNIGLDRNKLNAILNYSWSPKFRDLNTIELIDAEYVKNFNPNNFFNIYQSSYQEVNNIAKKHSFAAPYLNSSGNLEMEKGVYAFVVHSLFAKETLSDQEYKKILSVFERFVRLTRNDLILSTSYSYVSNNNYRYFEEDFQQFRFRVETAGNIPQLISKFLKSEYDENGQRQFFGVTYSQYAKAETEFIKHWPLGQGNVLAFRAFVGAAIPYGNGKSIPFSRSYFAGGANDNRAWRAYSLGPGRSGSVLDFNEANFKLSTNLEYRFPIRGALKGALFADVGNIWNILGDLEEEPESKLEKISDLQDIAIGTGFGLRYDLNYFILRLDMGMKTYDPALPMNQRWVQKLAWDGFTLNLGINYPF